jgi:hypothetical protein
MLEWDDDEPDIFDLVSWDLPGYTASMATKSSSGKSAAAVKKTGKKPAATAKRATKPAARAKTK